VSSECRTAEDAGRPPRGRAALAVFLAALMLATLGFTALGIWQLQRLQWKLALIERVESRIHAAPVAAPGPAEWPRIGAATHEYRRIRLQGRFLAGHDIRVQASTVLGSGFWLLSPLQTADGVIVLVNRGFVPSGWRGETLPAPAEVSGLLRLSEPGGAFLRRNDPAAGRWYSRDVAAIAAAQGLHNVAPYFVDAAAPAETAAIPSTTAGVTLGPDAGWPRPGLTVVRFRNPHLGYALTWFALALMNAGAAVYVARDACRRR
jgi:surfeit locus 1 family protein